jgi:hypothetical protein
VGVRGGGGLVGGKGSQGVTRALPTTQPTACVEAEPDWWSGVRGCAAEVVGGVEGRGAGGHVGEGGHFETRHHAAHCNTHRWWVDCDGPAGAEWEDAGWWVLLGRACDVQLHTHAQSGPVEQQQVKPSGQTHRSNQQSSCLHVGTPSPARPVARREAATVARRLFCSLRDTATICT